MRKKPKPITWTMFVCQVQTPRDHLIVGGLLFFDLDDPDETRDPYTLVRGAHGYGETTKVWDMRLYPYSTRSMDDVIAEVRRDAIPCPGPGQVQAPTTRHM